MSRDSHLAIEHKVNLNGYEFEFPSVFLFQGVPKSGKSYNVHYLLEQLIRVRPFFKNLWIFSQTKFSGQYDYAMPCVTNMYSPVILQKFLKRLRDLRSLYGRNMPSNCIVLDDVIGSAGADFKKDKLLHEIITQYRHYNLTLFICSQHVRSAVTAPIVRTDTRYVFAFPCGGEETMFNIYKAYGHAYNNYEDFKESFEKLTADRVEGINDYACLLIDKTKRNKKNNVRWVAGNVTNIPLFKLPVKKQPRNDRKGQKKQPRNDRKGVRKSSVAPKIDIEDTTSDTDDTSDTSEDSSSDNEDDGNGWKNLFKSNRARRATKNFFK